MSVVWRSRWTVVVLALVFGAGAGRTGLGALRDGRKEASGFGGILDRGDQAHSALASGTDEHVFGERPAE